MGRVQEQERLQTQRDRMRSRAPVGTQGPGSETGLQWVRVCGGSFLLGQVGLEERKWCEMRECESDGLCVI